MNRAVKYVAWGLVALAAFMLFMTQNRAVADPGHGMMVFPCMSQEQHNEYILKKYPNSTWVLLSAEEVALFKRNFDAMEPVGDANITNVLIYRNPKFPDLLISAEEDGCFRKGGAISQSAFDLQFLAP